MKFLFYGLSVFFLISCKSTKKTAETNNNTTAVSSEKPKNNTSDTLKSFTVSFFSIGSGIDKKIKTEYDAYLLKMENTSSAIKEKQIKRWGREGEVNYCFDLKTMETNSKRSFIEESVQLLGKSERVRVLYNKPCETN